jgi:hypothetical protein
LPAFAQDVAMWLRRSPMKIPASLPKLEGARELLGHLMDPDTAKDGRRPRRGNGLRSGRRCRQL